MIWLLSTVDVNVIMSLFVNELKKYVIIAPLAELFDSIAYFLLDIAIADKHAQKNCH